MEEKLIVIDIIKDFTELAEDYRIYMDKEREALQERAWFMFIPNGKLLLTNVADLYESNIGEMVIKLDYPTDWSEEQVRVALNERDDNS